MNARRVTLAMLFTLTEASFVAPVLAALPTPLQPLNHIVTLGLTWLMLSAIMGVNRALAARETGLVLQRAVLALWLTGLMVAFMFLKVAREGSAAISALTIVIQFTAATLVWWRGRVLGECELMPLEAQARLRNGLVLFSSFVIVTLLVPAYDWLTFLLPFLCSGLLALPLSYLERVEQTDVGRHVPMTRRWWRWVLLSAGLAVLAALGVMAIFTPDILSRALMLFVTAIVLPLAFLLGLFLDFFLRIIGSLFNRPESTPVTMPNLNALRPPLAEQTTTAASSLVISNGVIFAIVLVALFTMMLIMVYTTARVRHQPVILRGDTDEEDTHERDDAELPPAQKPPADTLGWRQWLAGITIRRVYARMIREAAKRGYTRQPAQTPYNYIPSLFSAFPGVDADVRLITDAYVAAHYGQAPDTNEELVLIRAAWERVRAVPHTQSAPTTSEAMKGA